MKLSAYLHVMTAYIMTHMLHAPVYVCIKVFHWHLDSESSAQMKVNSFRINCGYVPEMSYKRQINHGDLWSHHNKFIRQRDFWHDQQWMWSILTGSTWNIILLRRGFLSSRKSWISGLSSVCSDWLRGTSVQHVGLTLIHKDEWCGKNQRANRKK